MDLDSYTGITEEDCASNCLHTDACMTFSWQEDPPNNCYLKYECDPFTHGVSDTDVYIRTNGKAIVALALALTALKHVCINHGDQRVFFNLKS